MGRKGKSKIVFDEEMVTKEAADKLVAQHAVTTQINEDEKHRLEAVDKNENRSTQDKDKPKKKKKRKQKVEEEEVTKPKKPKGDDKTTQDEDENGAAEKPDSAKPDVKREDSIRAKKRMKHAALMQEKKFKADLALQQKCLNYLSQWKHNRGEWKFEKLKQVWLQQNMLSSEKVPEEVWDTLVEYFAGCKGKAREAVIKDALKVIDAEDGENGEGEEEDGGVKLKRARDVIQNLQE